MGDAISIADIGSPSSFATFFLLTAWIIRTWPHWKAKVNEARKIQLDADGDRLKQAFARIRDLEEAQSADRREFNDARSNDRREFNEAMSDERKRCDAEIEEVRRETRERLTALEEENRGLQATIRQNSQSTAQMIGRPDAIAQSIVQRGKDTK
jgi:hypothetical protein